MTKKIKSRKSVMVVVKEVVINICIFYLGWMGTFVVVFNHYWKCRYYILSILYFLKDVVKAKCTILYHYRYLIIM